MSVRLSSTFYLLEIGERQKLQIWSKNDSGHKLMGEQMWNQKVKRVIWNENGDIFCEEWIDLHQTKTKWSATHRIHLTSENASVLRCLSPCLSVLHTFHLIRIKRRRRSILHGVVTWLNCMPVSRSKDQRSRSLEIKYENWFCTYLREKWIDSQQTNTRMIFFFLTRSSAQNVQFWLVSYNVALW